MPLPLWILNQLAHPKGLVAPWVGRLLDLGNREQQRCTVDRLALRSTDCVLEIGFGGAGTFPRLLGAVPAGQVIGVEISEELVARAANKYSREIVEGRLRLEVATVEELPSKNLSVDCCVAINVSYFWRDLRKAYASILEILKPAGRLAISVANPDRLARMGFGERGFQMLSADAYVDLLLEAGFVGVRSEPLPKARDTILVLASRSET